MNQQDSLLNILFYYSGGRASARRCLADAKRLNYQEWERQVKETTLRTTLSRLKKRGLVKNRKRFWEITDRGRKYVKAKLSDPFRSRGPYPVLNVENRNMIIAFDIPEHRRKAREWLRDELRLLGFGLLQKSVWFGPSPLPKKFIVALNELNLIQPLNFFRATEAEII